MLQQDTDREGEKIAHLLFWWLDERGKKRGRRKKHDMIWRLNGLGALLICCSWQTDREGEKIAHLLFWWPD
jgi:hypothetical protein